MIDVRCICAIGLRGQLGLNGHLPWEGNTDPLFVEDVTRFFALTMGHVLIAGPKTVASVPEFAFKDRTIDVIRSHEDPEAVLKRYPGRRIFVGGGIAVWNVYAQYIQNWDITRLPYDGEADRWFDPAWLVGGALRAG